jgi:tetratricopeptide (TPR) repeat protein
VATLPSLNSRSIVSLAVFAAVCLPTMARGGEPATLRLPSWIKSLDDESARPDETTPTGSVTQAAPAETAHSAGVVPAAGADREPATVTPVADWNDPSPPSPVTAPVVPTAGERPAAQPAAGGFRRWISERVAALPKPTALLPAADNEPDPEPVGPTQANPPAVTQEQAPVTAPVAVTPDEMPTLSIDPASFRGALPGQTTRLELEEAWGPGTPVADTPEAASWQIEPFDLVEVSFEADTVDTISIKLAEPMTVADLARQLEIADLRTVAVRNDEGVEIGEVYPERGVILSIEPGTRQATAILIEPLDADAFVLRAEGELETCSAYALADLQYAVEIDPQHIRAHRLLLSMADDQGKWDQALELAEAATRLEPDNIWTRLKQAKILLAVDRPAEAREILEPISAGPPLPPLAAAQAARLLGRAAMAGEAPDHRAAVEHFTESIRTAAPLLSKRDEAVQAAVREVLLDAHLGTALAIAEGTWQQKSRVIPKWIVRSETLVKEFDGGDQERQVLELQLCLGALAAAAGSTESIEPLPWVQRLLELRYQMGDAVTDPWRRRQIDWEVGQGLADGLAAAQIRGDASDMLDNATLTAAYLERGAEHRELTPRERKDMGDLMFRIGILHSLQRGDHATAVTWFDRSIPLWDDNDCFAREGSLGRLGESYVSMAISYWQVDRREDALELSRRGVDLMVTAVDGGQLEERALAVAYGNLATMYAEQGDEQRSRNYAEMASRAEATGGTVR